MLERTTRHVVVPFLILAAVYGWSGCAEKQPGDMHADKTSRTLEDVIPLTAANLRGHQMLYNEGWFIITSSRKALEYAQAKALVASGQAIRAAQLRFMSHSFQYTESLNAGVQQSLEWERHGSKPVPSRVGGYCSIPAPWLSRNWSTPVHMR